MQEGTDEKEFDKVVLLLRSFLEAGGGYHIQFNAFGKELLLDAQKHPENYRNLVVRIAGYTIYFTELSKGAQNVIIVRHKSEFLLKYR